MRLTEGGFIWQNKLERYSLLGWGFLFECVNPVVGVQEEQGYPARMGGGGNLTGTLQYVKLSAKLGRCQFVRGAEFVATPL